MGSFSSSTTLKRVVDGDNSASITVEELSYNFDTNVSTIRITLSTQINFRWDTGGGYLWATIYAPWEDKYTSNQIYVQSETISNATTQPQGHVWSYSWTRTLHARYDGVTECSADWGWQKVGSNNYSSNTTYVSEASNIHTIGTHNRVSTLSINNTDKKITIDGASTLSMTVTRKSVLMTDHDLIISYPSATGIPTQTIQLRQGTTTSNTYQVPTGLLNYLPANGKSVTGQVILKSYYLPNVDDEPVRTVNSSPITFTAIARDSDIAPTLTLNAIDWTDDNNVTSGLVGNLNNYILNVSKCKITGTSQTKYNATPVSFGLFTNDNKSLGISDTGTSGYEFYLNQIAQNSNFSASNTLKVQITDSRGMTGSATVPLSFIPYIKKSLNETYDIARVNPTSPTVEINSVTGKWWNGNFLGNTNNDLTISWAYKEASSTGDYTTGGTLDTLQYSSGTPSGTYTSYDNTTQIFTISNYAFPQNFDYQKAYSIRLTVTDAVTGQTANPLYITISAGVPNFTIHKDTILINGKTIWDILYPIGSLYLSADYSFDPNAVFTGHTWVRVNGGYYLYAGTSTGQTGTNTGEGALSHVLTAAESGLPAHNHTGTANWVSLAGNAYNLMWDDGREGGMARDGIVSIGGWTRNRSWSGTNGDASRSLGVNASHSHGLTIDNTTAANATSGHTHPIATYKVAVWRRTA